MKKFLCLFACLAPIFPASAQLPESAEELNELMLSESEPNRSFDCKFMSPAGSVYNVVMNMNGGQVYEIVKTGEYSSFPRKTPVIITALKDETKLFDRVNLDFGSFSADGETKDGKFRLVFNFPPHLKAGREIPVTVSVIVVPPLATMATTPWIAPVGPSGFAGFCNVTEAIKVPLTPAQKDRLRKQAIQ